MTYKDSTDDDVDAEVLDFMPRQDFDLAHEAERLEKRLKFLATLARLWNVATRALREAHGADRQKGQEAVAAWLAKARKNYQGLLVLLDAIHEHEVPKPSGSYDSLVEFDNRRVAKERLLSLVITTCMDQALAVGALRGTQEPSTEYSVPGSTEYSVLSAQHSGEGESNRPGWESLVIRLERALLKKEPALARSWLPEFITLFKHEPLLYTPLSHRRPPPADSAGQHRPELFCAAWWPTYRARGLLRETYPGSSSWPTPWSKCKP